MPGVLLRQVPGYMVLKLWSFRSCSSSLFVDIPFVRQMLIPTVQTILQIIEIPHLQFVFGCRCPCCAGRANSQVLPWRRRSCSHSFSSLRNRRPLFPTTCALWLRLQKSVESPQLQFVIVVDIPFRAANADPHGPDYSADHRVPTVAVLSWWSMFLLAVVHILRCSLCEDSRDPTVAARARICRYGLRLCFRSQWLWCSCVCVLYGDVGKHCALALLGLVLVFIPVVAQRQLPWFAYSADHRNCPVPAH